MYWERAEQALGRLSIVGSLVKKDGVHLQQAYRVFKVEAIDVSPTYQLQSVNLDGWKATNQAWRTLFEGITIVLYFLPHRRSECLPKNTGCGEEFQGAIS